VLCQHTCVLWAGWHLRGRGDLTCVTVCSVMTYDVRACLACAQSAVCGASFSFFPK
jgi:hypothetical protein